MSRTLTDYRLPDGRVVPIDEDVARGAATVTFQLVGGTIVDAVRVAPVRPTPAPAWCHALAAQILSTVDEWAEMGGRDAHLPSVNDAHLRACIADLLEQELHESPDRALLARLAQVYTVDTDQVALIALVDEARLAVRQ